MMFLARLAVARPFAVVAVLVLITAVFASRLPSLAVDDGILNMIPADHPARLLQERIERDFGVRDVAVLAVENDQGIFNPASLQRVAQLTVFLQGLPGIVAEDVASLSATDNVVAEKDALLMRPPLAREGVSAEQARAVAGEVLDNPLFVGRLVSADGKVAAIYAPLAAAATRESVYAAVTKHLAGLSAPDNGDRILVAGKVMIEGGLGAAMRADLRRLAPVVLGVLLVLLWGYFRHPVLAPLTVLTAVVPVVWTLGLMAWLKVPIYVPTTLVPVILLIIGITEEVHLIGEYRRLGCSLDRRAAILEALNRIKRPVTFMTLTTAIGFASPVASPILPLTYFGLFTAFGIAVAYLLTFMLTPALLSLVKRPTSWDRPVGRASLALRRLGEVTAQRPRWVALLLVALGALALAGASQLRVDENWVKRFKPGHALYDSDVRLNRALGGTTLLYGQINTKADGLKDPALLARMEALQQAIAGLPEVGKVTSIIDLLKRTNRVLHQDERDWERLPPTREAVAQQLLLAEASGDPNDLDLWINPEASRALLWIQLKDAHASTTAALTPRLEALVQHELGKDPTIIFGGPASVNVAMADLVVTSQLRSLVLALGAEFLVLWVLYRSIAWTFVVMLPLAIALPAIFATLAAAGRYVDIPLAVLASIVIGLAVDYAIYVVDRYRTARAAGSEHSAAAGTALGESGTIVLADSVALGLGFCVLVLSDFAPLTAIGLMTAAVLVGSAILALLLPAVAGWLPLPAPAQAARGGRTP
jgi:hypothetical protein